MDCIPPAAIPEPQSPPKTNRAIKPGGLVRLGVEGSLSATSSTSASTVNTAAAAVDPMKARLVLERFSQFRCAAHATAAGAVKERKPEATPIDNASRNT